MDDSVAGFAMNFGFGAQYMILPQLGAGIFFDITKAFVSDLTYKDDVTKASVAASGFAFGLHLTSTYRETHPHQTDLQKVGFPFAWTFLPTANLLSTGIVLSFAYGGQAGVQMFLGDVAARLLAMIAPI